VAAGHRSFQIVSVCGDPPFHRVPWIQWPGGPTISQLSVPASTSEEKEVDKLTPFPRWLSFICYQEGLFCPCGQERQDSVKACFLPFIDHEQQGLQWDLPVHELREDHVPEQDMAWQSLSPKSSPAFQEETVLRAFRASTNQKTWDEIRLPRLSSAMSESTKNMSNYAPLLYCVEPSRFGQEEGAQLNLMQDLVGLRLAALGGTQIIRNVNYNVDNFSTQGVGDEEEDKRQPWQVHGSLLPKSLHRLTVQAACGSEWRFEPSDTNLRVFKTEHFTMDRDKATSFLYERFFVHLTSRWGQDSAETGWIESRTVFHLNERLDWNYLDQVLAGVYRIPPALPYPVDRGNLDIGRLDRRDSSSLSLTGDTRDGWQLRGALKQHMLILMPKSTLAASHAEIFRCVLFHLEGNLEIGRDPFDVFEQKGSYDGNKDLMKEALRQRQENALNQTVDEQSLPSRQTSRSEVQNLDGRRHSGAGSISVQDWVYSLEGVQDSQALEEPQPYVSRNTTVATTFENIGARTPDEVDLSADPSKLLEDLEKMRSQTVEQFKSFQEGLRRLLFGRMPKEDFQGELLDIDTDSAQFTVGRGEKQVPVRTAELETSFTQSRDWFGFFYDDVFCPPKCFHLVVEWIACSSIHMTAFLTKLEKLAGEHNFRLLRLPIGALFPQPAPAWIWSGDQETNFDRLPFYPRQRLSFPTEPLQLPREKVYAKLLEAWLQPPLSLHFIFSCPIQDFKVYPVVAEEDPKRTSAKSQVYQRLKGWVLCDSDGLALATLREDGIMFFENHIQVFEARTEERVQSNLRKVNQLRSQFFKITNDLLSEWRQPVQS
ncbi:HDHD3, partial [Symbiodinium pilosum]